MDTDATLRLYYRAKSKYRIHVDSTAIIRDTAIAGIVADKLAELWVTDPANMFIGDRNALGSGRGKAGAVVTWEGSGIDCWPFEFEESPVARALGDQFGIWFETINGSQLAIYFSEV